jgi:reversibly glycosylated polypeptide/UDP-arabinopyranose mutase
MKTALVVPTIREECINKFLDSWEEELVHFDQVIIVEDNPHTTFKINNDYKKISHYSWEDVDRCLKQNTWIISRRDSAIRSFGFLMAKDYDYIFSLDDDCLRIPEENFVESHLKNLNNSSRWTELIPGLRTRGLPYKNLGKVHVSFNVGLWTNIPDLDAIQQLANPLQGFQPNVVNRIIPRGQYFPFTGMNFCFRGRLAVMSYFPLMGEGYPYRRFDDIWFGIIAKKICDHLGLLISVGHPFVHHAKASDPFVNLVKEAPGIKMNEAFWETIDQIVLTSLTPTGCMQEIGEGLIKNEDTYLSKLGQAIMIWVSYF